MAGLYRLVQWDANKRRYDLAIGAGVVASVAAFAGTTALSNPGLTAETIIIRATAITALALLHIILVIGPLARLDARFLPLLYNRRHLGVTTFLVALVHGAFSTLQFHGFGVVNPLVSVLAAYGIDYAPGLADAPRLLPFEVFGVVALVGLFLLAATSHDFWLKHLGATIWKSLHQLVYLVYGLALAHVALGAWQSERGPALPVLMAVGFVVVVGLHLAAAQREGRVDAALSPMADGDGFVDVAATGELIEGRARVVVVGGERIALWLHGGRTFATSNVCRHQGGPLGEGRVLDGCVTCPWHGWNYRVEDGVSPPPFHERVTTYRTRVADGRVRVHPNPNPLGQREEGAALAMEDAR